MVGTLAASNILCEPPNHSRSEDAAYAYPVSMPRRLRQSTPRAPVARASIQPPAWVRQVSFSRLWFTDV